MPSAFLIAPPAVGCSPAGAAVAGSPAEALAGAGAASAPLVATGFAVSASEVAGLAAEAFEQALISNRPHTNVIIRFISMTSMPLAATDMPAKKPCKDGLLPRLHCKNYSAKLRIMSAPTENDRVAETENEAKPALSERVLIVEDDPATRVGLAELVGAWGFQTEVAANGEEAREKITTFLPAIIVSDLVMPRMSGLELLRGLKDQLTDLTLILLTAQGTIESAV